jgi:hypothetical protein
MIRSTMSIFGGKLRAGFGVGLKEGKVGIQGNDKILTFKLWVK